MIQICFIICSRQDDVLPVVFNALKAVESRKAGNKQPPAMRVSVKGYTKKISKRVK